MAVNNIVDKYAERQVKIVSKGIDMKLYVSLLINEILLTTDLKTRARFNPYIYELQKISKEMEHLIREKVQP